MADSGQAESTGPWAGLSVSPEAALPASWDCFILGFVLLPCTI